MFQGYVLARTPSKGVRDWLFNSIAPAKTSRVSPRNISQETSAGIPPRAVASHRFDEPVSTTRSSSTTIIAVHSPL